MMTKFPQYCLAWDEAHDVLYSGEKDGLINIWNLKKT